MQEIKQMLFMQQRFQIESLILSKVESEEKLDSDTVAYFFAWHNGVYPLFNSTSPWHTPFANHFAVHEEKIKDLFCFLDKSDQDEKYISFRELEARYAYEKQTFTWDRADLINALEYFHLHQQFGKKFWSSLLGEGAPSEAHGITRAYCLKEESLL